MKQLKWILATASAVVLAGCNAGMAPEPMTKDELKAAVDKATPEQQVKWVQASPMSAEEKAKRIKEIETKTGYRAPGSGAPGRTGQ